MSFITNISSTRCIVSFTHLYCRCISYPVTLLLYYSTANISRTHQNLKILGFLELTLLFGANAFLSQCISYTPKSVKRIALFCWDDWGLSRSVELIFWTKSSTDAMSSTDISLYTWYYVSPDLCVIACTCAVWASVCVCVRASENGENASEKRVYMRKRQRTHTGACAAHSPRCTRKCTYKTKMCVCKYVYLNMQTCVLKYVFECLYLNQYTRTCIHLPPLPRSGHAWYTNKLRYI